MSENVISVLICTRNRAESLRQTLASLKTINCPAGLEVEVLVVDNGSTDQTAAVLKKTTFENMRFRPLCQPKAGKSNAMNLAVSKATGDVLVFSDDDVRFTSDWLINLTDPILRGEADAVSGGIAFAPHLKRPDLQQCHKVMLTAADDPSEIAARDPWLVGANMAVARKVFATIPAFDPELGPGGIGNAEDTFFHLQVCQTGFRMVARADAVVEHHFDPARISSKFFRAQAVRQGELDGYIMHHWHHDEVRFPLARQWSAFLQLTWHRLIGKFRAGTDKLVGERELQLTRAWSLYRQYRIEARRPRNYGHKGLVRLVPA